MIARVVLLKLNEDALPERPSFAASCLRFLRALPMVEDVRVGVPCDEQSAKSWDLSLQVFFADDDALAAYQADEAHRAFLEQEILPRSAVRKAWNFAIL